MSQKVEAALQVLAGGRTAGYSEDLDQVQSLFDGLDLHRTSLSRRSLALVATVRRMTRDYGAFHALMETAEALDQAAQDIEMRADEFQKELDNINSKG